MAGYGFRPLRTGVDPLVEPDPVPAFAQAAKYGQDTVFITVGVADEYIGICPFVGPDLFREHGHGVSSESAYHGSGPLQTGIIHSLSEKSKKPAGEASPAGFPLINDIRT